MSDRQTELLLRSIAAMVKNAGGEITLPTDAVFGESGVAIMDSPQPGQARFRYFPPEQAERAIAEFEAARLLQVQREAALAEAE